MEEKNENRPPNYSTNDTADVRRQNKPLFTNIDASDVEGLETSNIDSLCMACGQTVIAIYNNI